MTRRVIAWVLLAGFVFLLVDILVLGWFSEISAIIYIIITVVFLLTMNRSRTDGIQHKKDAQDDSDQAE